MGKVLFSYSLFEPKSLFSEKRAHDKHNTALRYWYNLPLLPAINTILFPNSETRLYVSKSIWDNPLSEVISALVERFDSFKVVSKEDNYNTIEPTFWRFEPIFDKTYDAVFTRDVDSLPSKEEFLLSAYFLSDPNYSIQTIRSHPNHIFPITIMLAGLSGFKPKQISNLEKSSYEQFCETYLTEEYGSDQKALINFFTKDKDFVSNQFLDCRINKMAKLPKPLIDCKTLVYDKKLEKSFQNHQVSELIKYLEKNIAWSGEPIDIRGLPISDFLQLNYPAIKLLLSSLSLCSKQTRDFYLFKQENFYPQP